MNEQIGHTMKPGDVVRLPSDTPDKHQWMTVLEVGPSTHIESNARCTWMHDGVLSEAMLPVVALLKAGTQR